MTTNSVKRTLMTAALCTALVLTAASASAGPFRPVLYPVLLQRILAAYGIGAEVIDLERDDSFVKAVAIDFPDRYVEIGFPRTGIRRGSLFLLTVEDNEALMRFSPGGGMEYTNAADAAWIPKEVDDFVECILDAVDDFLDEIDDCGANPFCYVFASIELSTEISFCPFDIF